MEDKTSTEYHLTPDGWITGTGRYFDKIEGKEVQRPLNSVETIKVTTEQASMWSKQYSYSESIWRSPDIGDADLEALYQKFPMKFPDRR
jgi:hypothetical protein